MGMTIAIYSKNSRYWRSYETVDANYNGDDLTIAFNAEYLLKGLEIAPVTISP